MSIDWSENIPQTSSQTEKINVWKLLKDITSDWLLNAEDNPNLKKILDSQEFKDYEKAKQEHKDFLKSSLETTLKNWFTIWNQDFYENISSLLEKNWLTNGQKLPSYDEVLQLNWKTPEFIIKFDSSYRDKIWFFNSKWEDFWKFILGNWEFSKTRWWIKNDNVDDNNQISQYNWEDANEQENPQSPENSQTPESSSESILSSLLWKNWKEIHNDENAVKEIQRILNENNTNVNLKIDWKIWPKTVNAIKKFQASNKLNYVDWKVWNETLTKLIEVDKNKSNENETWNN